MGPISPYGPKQFGRLTEQDIFNESQKFMAEQQLCDKNDDLFLKIRRVIADINIYGHRHLLDHVRNTPDKVKKVQFLLHWRTLHLKDLDVLFQNLIRKKILRIDEEQHFTKVDLVEKYKHPEGRRLYVRGQELLRQGKVAIVIFMGCTSGRGDEGFIKQFHKVKESQSSLFQLYMQRLTKIADQYGCPPTYIFHSAATQARISEFLKDYKYASNIQLCLQKTHPILNLNGNLCLKTGDAADVIQLPCGSGDFYQTTINDENILDRMRRQGVKYVSCAESDNLLEMVADPFMVGLAAEVEQVVYKCSFPSDPKDKLQRRVVVQNGVVRADTPQTLSSFINYNHRYRAQNNQNVFASPIWMGSSVFPLEPVSAVLQGPNKPPTFPVAVNYIMKNMNFWSPIDTRTHNQQSCYVFQRQTSDLLINHLFKSRAVLVDREEECLLVMTEKKEYGLENAMKELESRKGNQQLKPFYERYEEEQAIRANQEKERLERQAKETLEQQVFKQAEAQKPKEQEIIVQPKLETTQKVSDPSLEVVQPVAEQQIKAEQSAKEQVPPESGQ